MLCASECRRKRRNCLADLSLGEKMRLLLCVFVSAFAGSRDQISWDGEVDAQSNRRIVSNQVSNSRRGDLSWQWSDFPRHRSVAVIQPARLPDTPFAWCHNSFFALCRALLEYRKGWKLPFFRYFCCRTRPIRLSHALVSKIDYLSVLGKVKMEGAINFCFKSHIVCRSSLFCSNCVGLHFFSRLLRGSASLAKLGTSLR